MEYIKLKAAAETITMPDEMKQRIVRSCRRQISNSRKELDMKTNHHFSGKSAAAFSALAICLTLSATAVATSGVLEGFFRDITNWQGAVVGTSYEQATDEIDVNVTVNSKELTVLAAFADPQTFPYREVEKLGIAEYRIADTNGRTVSEGAAASAEVINGHAAISIPLDDLDSGSYTLMIDAFAGEKKAEQPLKINGSWECTFTR